MSETTVFAVAAGDGRVDGRDASFATAQAKTTGDNAFDAEASFPIAVRINGGEYIIERGFFPFDATAIDNGDIPSVAVMGLWGISIGDSINDGTDWINIVGPTTQNDFVSLEVADYDQCGDAIDDPTELSDARIDLGSAVTGAYNDWAFNAAGLAVIDFTQVFSTGAREGHDATDTDPGMSGSNANRLTVSASDETGTSQDPKLVITHAPPSTGAKGAMLLLGAG